MKTGWWSMTFHIKLEGAEIGFEELSEDSRRHILNLLAQGCVAGEVIEGDDDDD